MSIISIRSNRNIPNLRRYFYGFHGINDVYRLGRISDRGVLLSVPATEPADGDAQRAQNRHDETH